MNRTSAILRDILNESFNSITINDEALYQEIKTYIKTIAPDKEKITEYYAGNQIFNKENIDKQIKALFGKTVAIKSGAYLIIEHTEALHVIDVNSGNRSKPEANQETTALEVNMAAAEEIARQLRLRDMGGIIVVDFIDMVSFANKKTVFQKMKSEMENDRAKHSILPLSKFGLMQITRQRVRPEMNIETNEKCPTCRGTGEITPSIIFTDELENNLKFLAEKIAFKIIIIKTHPYIAAYLTKGLNSIRKQWSRKYKKKLKVESVNSYQYLEYHFFDREGEEIFI